MLGVPAFAWHNAKLESVLLGGSWGLERFGPGRILAWKKLQTQWFGKGVLKGEDSKRDFNRFKNQSMIFCRQKMRWREWGGLLDRLDTVCLCFSKGVLQNMETLDAGSHSWFSACKSILGVYFQFKFPQEFGTWVNVRWSKLLHSSTKMCPNGCAGADGRLEGTGTSCWCSKIDSKSIGWSSKRCWRLRDMCA